MPLKDYAGTGGLNQGLRGGTPGVGGSTIPLGSMSNSDLVGAIRGIGSSPVGGDVINVKMGRNMGIGPTALPDGIGASLVGGAVLDTKLNLFGGTIKLGPSTGGSVVSSGGDTKALNENGLLFQGNRNVKDAGDFVRTSDMYTTLKSGEKIGRFDTYSKDLDNLEAAAAKQTTLEKWGNGVLKFGTKTTANFVGGTLGFVNGVAMGAQEGSLNAFYDNDFADLLDDFNTQMDVDFPNHISKAEREKSFLASMGAANFWANDVLGAASFVAGTVASEALWAWGTGGASLAASLPKLGTKIFAKSFAKNATRETGEKIFKDWYRRTIPLSKAGKAINNARFIATSSGFEAGFEARAGFDESLVAFEQGIQKTYGRSPTEQEYREYLPAAVDVANNVFAANIPIIATSNIVALGAILKLDMKIANPLKGLTKSILGTSTKRTITAGGIEYVAGTPNKVQKIVGNTLSYLKAPLTEGYFEEGGQGFVSKSGDAWLMSRFNPTAVKENMNLADSMAAGFHESYGTKEGFKEIGIGMLIGGGMGRISAVKEGGFSNVLGNDFQAEQKRDAFYAGELTAQSKQIAMQLGKAQASTIRKFGNLNSMHTSMGDSNSRDEATRDTAADFKMEETLFTAMGTARDGGLLDSFTEDLMLMMDAVEEGDRKNAGVEHASELKERVKIISERVDQAYELAEALAPNLKKPLLGIVPGVTDMMAYEMFMGMTAGARAGQYATMIEGLILTDGQAMMPTSSEGLSVGQKGNMLGTLEEVYETFDRGLDTLRNRRDEKVEAEYNLEKARRELEDLTQLSTEVTGISASKVDGAIEGEITTTISAIDQARINLEDSQAEYDIREAAYNESKESYTRVLKAKGIVQNETDVDSLLGAEDAIQEYEDALKAAIEDPNTSERTKQQLADDLKFFQDAIGGYKHFSNMDKAFRRSAVDRASKGFTDNQGSLLTKLIGRLGINEPVSEEEGASEISTFIEANKDKLTEDEIITLKVYDSAIKRAADYTKSEAGINNTIEDTTEPVSDEEYKGIRRGTKIDPDTATSINSKVAGGVALSPREQFLYDNYKDELSAQPLDNRSIIDEIAAVAVPVEDARAPKTLAGRLQDTVDKVKGLVGKLLDKVFGEEETPTKEELEEFEALSKGGDTSSARYKELKAMIDQWAVSRNIMVGGSNGFKFSDLLKLLRSLLKPKSSKALPKKVVVDLEELLGEDPEFIEDSKGRRLSGLVQSYDKALVSMRESGDAMVIHNLTHDAVLEIFKENGFKRAKMPDGTHRLSKGAVVLTVSKDKFGNTVVRAHRGGALIDIINDDTDLRVLRLPGTSTRNYHPLYRNTPKGLDTIESDFDVVDNEAIYNMQKNEELTLSYDKDNEWNAQLLSDPNATTEDIINGAVITVSDGDGNVLGVLKSTYEDVTASEQSSVAKLRILREAAISGEASGEVRTVRVKGLYLGYPDLKMEEVDGKVKVVFERIKPTDRKRIVAVGYIAGDTINTSGLPRTVIDMRFVTRIKDEHPGTVIPFVVINNGGRNIAYPAKMDEIAGGFKTELDGVLGIQDAGDAVVAMNNLLSETGFDVNKVGVLPGDVGTAKWDDAVVKITGVPKYVDFEGMVARNDKDGFINASELPFKSLITPFHSPKFSINLGDAVDEILREKGVSGVENTNLSPELQKEVDGTTDCE